MYIDEMLPQLADTPSIIEWHLHNGFPVKLIILFDTAKHHPCKVQ